MGIESSRKPTIPDYTMPITQVAPREVADFGTNIVASINETIIAYVQGLFKYTKKMPHEFNHEENAIRGKKIHITDPGGEEHLDQSSYPRIVVSTDGIRPLGMTGINSLAGLDFKTGIETKIELFSGNVVIQVYGKYTEVQQYGSLLLMSLTFLTRPLKLFTIYKVGKPSLTGLRKFRPDGKGFIWTASIRLNILKEGSAVISNTNIVELRKIIFKCRQVFTPGQERVVVVLS